MHLRSASLFVLLSVCCAFGCAVGLTDRDIDDDDGGLTSGGGDDITSATGGGGASAGSASGGAPATGGAPSTSSGDPNSSSSSAEASSSAGTTSSQASSSSASSTVSSSSSSVTVSSSSSGGGGGCPTAPVGLMGCPSCGGTCSSPWNASWSPSAGATHYIIEYQCLVQVSSYQTSATQVDLCSQVGMCNNNLCANGAGPVTVKACDAQCCSTPVTLPSTPIACGGGVCC